MRAVRVRRAGPGAAALALLTLLASSGGPPARAAPAEPVDAARAAPDLTRDPGCGVMVLALRPGALAYRLEHGFLREAGDSVWSRAFTLVRGRDYVLDAVRGELRLLRSELPGDTLWIAACWLLQPPPTDFQLEAYRPLDETPADSTSAPAPAPSRRPATARTPGSSGGASLTLTGNKTVAVDFGSSQDAFLRQSLDLAVSGTLAPGVELTGVLTDRNTPLSATGATQDLQSLDRVLVELRAPRASATLGDLTLDVRQGEFGRLERRLQGVRGTWRAGPALFEAAAASAAGEYHRAQFFGVEGRQGPYTLTDRDGREGISLVAGSEVVTLDGERLVRGESADYAMDYERAQLTFSNRRPITFASRITVEYQYAVNRYRRNFAAAGGRWERDGRTLFTQVVTEGDDQGRPLDLTLGEDDRTVLAFAGDSAAIGSGVTAGGGDYDTVRVAGALVFAFAGPDSGAFAVRFTRLGEARGDYADSTVVGGRTIFRHVGTGLGAWAVGRGLPLPESHQLWSGGAGIARGPLALEVEGALSRLDRNTLSSRDDGDNAGAAARATLALEGALPGSAARGAGLRLSARTVGQRFTPFARLEAPFAEEDWGLPLGADLERQQRVEASAFYRPRPGGELRAAGGRLETPGGFSSWRRSLEWSREGPLMTRARWAKADGRQDGVRFANGGREQMSAALAWRLPWIEPGARAATDERRFPSDSGRVGDRFREGVLELRSGRRLPWQLTGSFALRRDARLAGSDFTDQTEARTARLGVESPAGGAFGGAFQYQRRDLRALADVAGGRSDLASLRLRADDAARGIQSRLNVELTSEGENRRSRTLVFVGPGMGAYDALGNFVGTGDYDLVVSVDSALDRVSRIATSGRAAWTFGASDAWRGSRVAFDYETEVRRRGVFRGGDAWIAPGAVLGDPALARGALLQRLEAEIAPGAPAAAVRLRLERRVSADRSFANFAQTLDDRHADLRWRVRPGGAASAEFEARTQRQVAEQRVPAGPSYERVLVTHTGTSRLIVSPNPRLRAVLTLDGTLSRPEGADAFTRTLRLGPDVGVSVGPRGRVELTARRAFTAGPPATGLLPAADPAGFPRWDGTARFDYRVRQSTTVGLTYAVRAFESRRAQSTGRAEVRAFF
jgi:hypothetical protein